jgi:Arc/MetJ-type ribon-helix-helix transcriptional regulator
MVITLTPEQAQFVQSQLAESDYKSPEDFSQAALTLLARQDWQQTDWEQTDLRQVDLQQTATEDLDDREDISYNPMPPKRTFTVKARLRFTGRSQPIPYNLNDD